MKRFAKYVVFIGMILLLPVLIFSQQIILDKPVKAGELTLFPDMNDQSKYYYVLDKARLATENGKPKFSFIRYVDNVSANSNSVSLTEATGGGIVHAMVTLEVTTEQIREAERDLRRLHPDATIEGPIIFKSGKFALISSFTAENGDFTRNVIGMGTAPILDGQKAAISMQLTKLGSQLLWESFKTSTPDITFSFEMTMGGFRLPKRAVITADFEDVYKSFDLNIQAGFTIKGKNSGGDDDDDDDDNDRDDGDNDDDDDDSDDGDDDDGDDDDGDDDDGDDDDGDDDGDDDDNDSQQEQQDDGVVEGGNQNLMINKRVSNLFAGKSSPSIYNGRMAPVLYSTLNWLFLHSESNILASYIESITGLFQWWKGDGRYGEVNSKLDDKMNIHASSSPGKSGFFIGAEIQYVFEELRKTGAIKVEQFGDDEDIDKLVTTAYTKLANLMFDRVEDNSRQRNNPQQMLSQLRGNQQGNNRRSSLNGIMVSYKMNEKRRTGSFRFDLNKWTNDEIVLRFDENIGNLSDYQGDPDVFRQFNLDDPLYQQREILAMIDGYNAQDFGTYINFVSVHLKKTHAEGHITDREVRIDRINFNQTGNAFSMMYGWHGDNDRSKWMNYEYEVLWSFFGDVAVKQEFTPSTFNTINLAPPYQKYAVELEADPTMLGDQQVRLITVQIFYDVEGKEFTKQTTLVPSRNQLSQKIEFIAPTGNLNYEYEVTWRLKGNKTVKSGRQQGNDSVLFVDELPESEN